jgi:NAD(P)-dependent dehydrogenase (short-subunit alcohol dehydrogenase family)
MDRQRVAIVTAASGGIGRSIALACARKGYAVVPAAGREAMPAEDPRRRFSPRQGLALTRTGRIIHARRRLPARQGKHGLLDRRKENLPINHVEPLML